MRTLVLLVSLIFCLPVAQEMTVVTAASRQVLDCQPCSTLPACAEGGPGIFTMRCSTMGVGMNCCNEPGMRSFCSGYCAIWWMARSYLDEERGVFVADTFHCCACDEFCTE